VRTHPLDPHWKARGAMKVTIELEVESVGEIDCSADDAVEEVFQELHHMTVGSLHVDVGKHLAIRSLLVRCGDAVRD